MEVVKAQGMVTAVLVIRGLQGTIVKEVKNLNTYRILIVTGMRFKQQYNGTIPFFVFKWPNAVTPLVSAGHARIVRGDTIVPVPQAGQDRIVREVSTMH